MGEKPIKTKIDKATVEGLMEKGGLVGEIRLKPETYEKLKEEMELDKETCIQTLYGLPVVVDAALAKGYALLIKREDFEKVAKNGKSR